MNLFGRKPAPAPAPARNTAATVEKMNGLVQRIEKKIKFTEKEVDKLTREAQAKAKAGDKNGAKRLLKLRKMKQNKITKLGMQHYNVSGMLERVKEAGDLGAFVDGMHEAAGVVRDTLGDQDEIEEKLDDVADINADFEAVDEAVAGRELFSIEGTGEDELEDELDALFGEVGAEAALEAPSVPAGPTPAARVEDPVAGFDLPAAPTGDVAVGGGAGGGRVAEEDDVFGDLEAEMGI
mmetsp:Transcript_20281/g.47903  ORF Transcript_20281/g.47903 Transcript_20281/m.47903 type:complete len:237 (-) Transcript_20281:23-733(-)